MGSTSDDAVRGVEFIARRHSIEEKRELETQIPELLGYLLDRTRWCKMHDVV